MPTRHSRSNRTANVINKAAGFPFAILSSEVKMDIVYCYYKGTSLALPRKAFDGIQMLNNDMFKVIKFDTISCKNDLDTMEQRLCDISSTGKYLGRNQDDILREAFPGKDTGHMILKWVTSIRVLLDEKVIANDDENGWLLEGKI